MLNTASAFIHEVQTSVFNNDVNIIQTKCTFNINNYDERLFDFLRIKKNSTLCNAVKKRKAEYLAGRYCAQHSLQQLGITGHDISIGCNRSPVWPEKIIGSISHNSNTAICIMAYKTNISDLGVDIESIIPLQTASEIKHSVINIEEEKILSSQKLTFEQSFTLAFSCKESLFKALYPSVKKYFDFNSARIISFDLIHNKITLQLQSNLAVNFPMNLCIDAYFLIQDNEVITWVSRIKN